MLRITRIPTDDARTITLKLEGKLLQAWTDEVRSAVEQAIAGDGQDGRVVRLDLSTLMFVDAAGAGLLRELIASDRITIGACSSFLTELLNLEARR